MHPPADAVPTQGIPSPGQLVTVPQRRYVVTDCTLVRPQHLIRLQSIDDEGVGDELSVLWEIEPGRQLDERASLPDPAPRPR